MKKTGRTAALPRFMKRRRFLLTVLFLCLMSTGAPAAPAGKLSFKKSAVTLYEKGQTYLKVVGYSRKKAIKQLTFTSSRPGVASVSAAGIVKAKKAGIARIRVTGRNKKAGVCIVTVKKRTGTAKLSRVKGKIRIVTDDVTRKYTPYYETAYAGYISSRGCVHTAVSVAASAFGIHKDPLRIHQAAAGDRYGERYAVAHMKDAGKYPNMYGQTAISVRTAGSILKNMGIAARTVTSFTTASAVKEIRRHLKKGNPVIIKVNNRQYGGVYLTSGHHAMVLLGLNADGTVIVYDTAFGRVNVAAMNGARVRMKLETLVKQFMTPPAANQRSPYVLSMADAGGYILVG